MFYFPDAIGDIAHRFSAGRARQQRIGTAKHLDLVAEHIAAAGRNHQKPHKASPRGQRSRDQLPHRVALGPRPLGLLVNRNQIAHLVVLFAVVADGNEDGGGPSDVCRAGGRPQRHARDRLDATKIDGDRGVDSVVPPDTALLSPEMAFGQATVGQLDRVFRVGAMLIGRVRRKRDLFAQGQIVARRDSALRGLGRDARRNHRTDQQANATRGHYQTGGTRHGMGSMGGIWAGTLAPAYHARSPVSR